MKAIVAIYGSTVTAPGKFDQFYLNSTSRRVIIGSMFLGYLTFDHSRVLTLNCGSIIPTIRYFLVFVPYHNSFLSLLVQVMF